MISMAVREAFNGAPGPVYLEIPRDVLDREVDVTKAVMPKPGHYRASTHALGDPRDIEKLADILVDSERPAILYGQQVWTARGHEEAIALLRGLDIPGYFNGGSRGLLPPGDPHHFDRTRSNAFAEADVIVIVGTPFDFRMGYGKRISNKLKLVQIDMDYRTVGKNRDIDLGLVGDPGAILGAVLQAASGRIKQDKRQARQQWMKKLAGPGRDGHRKADAALQVQQPPDPSLSRRLRAQRVPRRQHHLHRRRRRCRDDLRAGGAAAPPRPVDGPGRARLARRRHGLRDRGGARASRQGGAVLLRRRLLRHDGLRHGDGQPLRRALHRAWSATTRP